MYLTHNMDRFEGVSCKLACSCVSKQCSQLVTLWHSYTVQIIKSLMHVLCNSDATFCWFDFYEYCTFCENKC
jgi:aminopeptidase-like protein